MQKSANLVDLVKNFHTSISCGTCKNRLRCSRERASQGLEAIQFILSFEFLFAPRRGRRQRPRSEPAVPARNRGRGNGESAPEPGRGSPPGILGAGAREKSPEGIGGLAWHAATPGVAEHRPSAKPARAAQVIVKVGHLTGTGQMSMVFRIVSRIYLR